MVNVTGDNLPKKGFFAQLMDIYCNGNECAQYYCNISVKRLRSAFSDSQFRTDGFKKGFVWVFHCRTKFFIHSIHIFRIMFNMCSLQLRCLHDDDGNASAGDVNIEVE